jgi:hypothetical protein
MSNMSNAVVAGLSTTGTGSGGDGICSVSGALVMTSLYHLLPLLAQPIDTERHHADALAKPSTDADAAASLTKSTLIDYENGAKYAKGLFETLTDRHIADDQLKPSVTA